MPGRDWKRLAEFVVRDRVAAGYRTRLAFSEDLGISDRTIGNLERGKSVSASTLGAVEVLLDWAPGSVNAVLDGGEPAPLREIEPSSNNRPSHAPDADTHPSFDEAIQEYRRALRKLRRVAAADPHVPPDVRDVIEDFNTYLQALLYGGVAGVRKAAIEIVGSYERDRLGEEDSPRAG